MTAETEQPTTVPVTLATIDGPREVQGELVAPGIAITESIDYPGWYHLTHVPSGLGFTRNGALQDRDRMRDAGRQIIATGINWDQPMDALRGVDAAAGNPTGRIIEDLYWEDIPAEEIEAEEAYRDELRAAGIVQASDVLHLLPENQPETDAEGYSWGDAATWSASYEANEAEIDAYRSTVDEATI